MPPAAISRSSTYFPKICGNIAVSHRSASALLLLALATSGSGCGPVEARVERLEIRVFGIETDATCAVPTDATLEIRALGPFPITPLAAEVLPVGARGRVLSFPPDTRGVAVRASDGNRVWLGYSERRHEQGIDVLLWPERRACELFDPVDELADYPTLAAGEAFGASAAAGIVLAAGGDEAGSAAGSALVFEAEVGRSALVSPGTSIPEARSYATVTEFGTKLLVAGGENPLDPARPARQSAAVYDPAAGGFETATIALEQPRTRHAALVMANGETLLVGGSRPSGDGEAPGLVVPLEAVSPSAGRARIAGLAALAPGRIEPVAIRLSDDRILVGGGYDANRAPLDSVQWFSADGACSEGTSGCREARLPPNRFLPPRHHRAFVALPGGGALTVGGCAPSAEQDDDCEAACGAGYGCPAPVPDAFWIAPSGEIAPVTFDAGHGCPEPLSPERALLAPGSDGSPWLVAYDEDVHPPCRRLFRFDPWRAAFAPVALDLRHWPDPRRPLVSLGPDAFVWLASGEPPLLAGLRTGNRGSLSYNDAPLVPGDPRDPFRPLHLAPDRASSGDAAGARYDAVTRRLTLEAVESRVAVYVTDTSYEDVRVTLEHEGAPPVVLLGAARVGESAGCPWPDGDGSRLVVERRGESLRVTRGTTRTCETARSGATSVGFRAGEERTIITLLAVERL